MPDRTGQQLGNYVLKSLLGQGGFADVYLGEHIYLKRLVAVKVLQMRMTQMESQEFVQEARTIASLEHNNIVPVYEFDVDGDASFLVMYYAPLGSLRDKHSKGTTLPLTTIVTYANQVAAALQYAHDRNIIHRDIKPENMLLRRRDDVIVSDFGLAVVADSKKAEGQREAGTARYMAPEQFKGYAVPASDQYSLAVTVYEWLTGSPPFDEGNFIQLGYQHRFKPVPPFRKKDPAISIPPQVEQVVLKGLNKEPGQRFESVKAFAKALEQAYKAIEPAIGKTLFTFQHDNPGHYENPIWTVRWSPDKVHIASGSVDGSIHIWNGITGIRERFDMPYGSGNVLAVAWSPDGKRFAFSGPKEKVYIWNSEQRYEILQYTEHSDKIRALSWSPDGNFIVSGGGSVYKKGNNSNFPLHIWDTRTGKRLLTCDGHKKEVYALQWAPNGLYIASGGDDRVVHIWEAATGKQLYTYPNHSRAVNALAWSPDSDRLVSVSVDATAQVWDALTGGNILIYPGHKDPIQAVDWSLNGRFIASGGRDHTVQIWDAKTGNIICTYNGHSDDVYTLSWSPDSTRIASGGKDKTVQVWQARAPETYRPDASKEGER